MGYPTTITESERRAFVLGRWVGVYESKLSEYTRALVIKDAEKVRDGFLQATQENRLTAEESYEATAVQQFLDWAAEQEEAYALAEELASFGQPETNLSFRAVGIPKTCVHGHTLESTCAICDAVVPRKDLTVKDVTDHIGEDGTCMHGYGPKTWCSYCDTIRNEHDQFLTGQLLGSLQ